MRSNFEFRPQHFENALDIAENIVVPNPNCPVPRVAHRLIALGVCSIARMLAAMDLDHEMPLAAYKVREIRSDRLLTHEFTSHQLPVAKMPP